MASHLTQNKIQTPALADGTVRIRPLASGFIPCHSLLTARQPCRPPVPSSCQGSLHLMPKYLSKTLFHTQPRGSFPMTLLKCRLDKPRTFPWTCLEQCPLSILHFLTLLLFSSGHSPTSKILVFYINLFIYWLVICLSVLQRKANFMKAGTPYWLLISNQCVEWVKCMDEWRVQSFFLLFFRHK